MNQSAFFSLVLVGLVCSPLTAAEKTATVTKSPSAPNPVAQKVTTAPVTKTAVTQPIQYTICGKTYLDCKVIKVWPDGLSLQHSGGIVRVPMEDLPATLKKKYTFQEKGLAQYRKEEADRQIAAKQAVAEDRQMVIEETMESERKAALADQAIKAAKQRQQLIQQSAPKTKCVTT